MILVNGTPLEPNRFPDGAMSLRFSPGSASYTITWKYDDDKEYILLWYLVNHIRAAQGQNVPIKLDMPYVPNARMDRVKNDDEVFTLKWFAEFINSMSFSEVTVLDAHSSVTDALINRVGDISAIFYVKPKVISALHEMGVENLIFCYPDEGAMKRYSGLIRGEYVFGIKHRDWRTGKIEKLELANSEKAAGRDVLIIDDICSKGGTFTHTAKALKAAGAGRIYLYVSHCENTIFKGSVLTDGLIEHVFTTDSIYRGEHEKITVLEWK